MSKNIDSLVVGEDRICDRFVGQTQTGHWLKFLQMGKNKLKNIKNPEVVLRKTVLVKNSIKCVLVSENERIQKAYEEYRMKKEKEYSRE